MLCEWDPARVKYFYLMLLDIHLIIPPIDKNIYSREEQMVTMCIYVVIDPGHEVINLPVLCRQIGPSVGSVFHSGTGQGLRTRPGGGLDQSA